MLSPAFSESESESDSSSTCKVGQCFPQRRPSPFAFTGEFYQATAGVGLMVGLAMRHTENSQSGERHMIMNDTDTKCSILARAPWRGMGEDI